MVKGARVRRSRQPLHADQRIADSPMRWGEADAPTPAVAVGRRNRTARSPTADESARSKFARHAHTAVAIELARPLRYTGNAATWGERARHRLSTTRVLTGPSLSRNPILS
jgi:hypothetical protein